MKRMLLKLWVSMLCFQTLSAQAGVNTVRDTVSTTDPHQLVEISGLIRDASTGKELFGAIIQNSDKSISTIADEKGHFVLRIPRNLTQLVVSAPDFTTVQVAIRGNSHLEVALYPKLPAFTIPSSLTADAQIQSLNAADIRVVTRSGTPGIGAAMFIRGYNSLYAGAQPLVVVDGIIMDNQYNRSSIHDGYLFNPLSAISVEDIESIQVLKEGAALYGSKGANGVVMISTKRGQSQVTKIAFSATTAYNEQPATLPLLKADQYRVYVSDLLKTEMTDPGQLASLPYLNNNSSYYDYARYHNQNDWSKNVYRNSLTHLYDINVSGGDNIALYNLSLGYAEAGSTMKENKFSRFNARFNSDINLTDRIRFSFDIAYSQTDRKLNDDGLSEEPGKVITSPGILAAIKAPFLIPYEHSTSGTITSELSDADIFGLANPLSVVEKGLGSSSQSFFTLSVRPSYSISKSLQLKASMNYSLNSLYEKYYRPDAGVPQVFLPEYDGFSTSFVQGQNARQVSVTANIYSEWVKRMKMQQLTLQGGFRFLNDQYQGEYGSGHNTPTDLNPNLSASLLYRKTLGYDDRWRTISWYVNTEYALLEKYFLSASLSVDASSRYGRDAGMLQMAGVPWGVYPSANAGWLVSSESFMKNADWITRLMLRGGMALTGNDNIPIGSAITYFSSIRYINQYTGIDLVNIGNTRLKPESTYKLTGGVDVGLFNNRLEMSVDVYRHTTDDLLALKHFHYSSGMNSYWENGGKMQNTGAELTINAKAVVVNHFQWEIGASIARYTNTILELPGDAYTTPVYGGEVQTKVGQAAGVFWGFKTDGVFATDQEARQANLSVKDPTGVGTIPFTAGDIRFIDANNDDIIDENDKTIIGDPNPAFTGALFTRMVYKRFSLNALFNYSYGNDVYNYFRSQLESGSTLYNQSSAMQNRWVNEGQQTQLPKSSFNDVMGNSRFSDRWIEDGSYLRLKTLALSYDFPVNSMFINGIGLWISATNLWTLTRYLGVDPEFSVSNSVLYQGIDAGWLAQGRSYHLGVKLNL